MSQIDGSGGGLISCGIIARSAGLFKNSAKKFCACDGVPIWDERDREERLKEGFDAQSTYMMVQLDLTQEMEGFCSCQGLTIWGS